MNNEHRSPWSDAPETLNEWRASETLRPDPRSKRMAHHAVKMERERNALRDQMKDNPWCAACREADCCVSMDGTCAMIRKYLKNADIVNPISDPPSEQYRQNVEVLSHLPGGEAPIVG